MEEWFNKKKSQFYDWLEDSSWGAKAGAVIFLLIAVALLVAFPLGFPITVAFIIFCIGVFWLLMLFLDSILDHF